MKPWLLYSLAVMGVWGTWGFFARMAARSVTPQNLVLLGAIGGLLMYPIFFAIFHEHLKFNWHNADCYYAVIGGILGTIGALLFFWAISRGEASRVVPITAMYPVITVILAWLFLKEPLTAQKITGIVFAMLGVCLLSR